jgi:hypothetical protein
MPTCKRFKCGTTVELADTFHSLRNAVCVLSVHIQPVIPWPHLVTRVLLVRIPIPLGLHLVWVVVPVVILTCQARPMILHAVLVPQVDTVPLQWQAAARSAQVDPMAT